MNNHWLDNAVFIPKNDRQALKNYLGNKKSLKLKRCITNNMEVSYEVMEANNIVSIKIGEIIDSALVQKLKNNRINIQILT